jgi:hypothetical protein
MDLIAYLLCLALEVKDKPRKSISSMHFCRTQSPYTEHHGLSRALSYILESLSAYPAMGNKMPNQLRTRVPAKWSIQGSLGDFIINVCSIFWLTHFLNSFPVYLFYNCNHIRST